MERIIARTRPISQDEIIEKFPNGFDVEIETVRSLDYNTVTIVFEVVPKKDQESKLTSIFHK